MQENNEVLDRTTISQAAADAFKAGDAVGGGYYAGQIRQTDGLYVLIVAPKDGGELDDIAWNGTTARVEGAQSYFDGRANTVALTEAGSELGKWALGLQVNGNHDWYLPSRDELEILYRNLKPTAEENYASFRDGENASSVPVGYPYTASIPTQSDVDLFREDGPEAFESAWYWSSTQSARGSGYAWVQTFGDGFQDLGRKGDAFRARAVRRL
ncbi:DUF1566 domain-containing protein, partial [Cupriavidus necator]|uniref:Lcl domain-containing protein n=1 Tax=Cupriavidus necator TaxID=106590 RepID=UPI0030F3F8FB